MTRLTDHERDERRALYNRDLVKKVDAERRIRARRESRERARMADAAIKAMREKAAREVEILRERRETKVHPAEIIEMMAVKHGVSVAEIKGRSRIRTITRARQESIAEIKRMRPDMSMTHIGKFFGGLDHTTCLWACKKYGVPTS